MNEIVTVDPRYAENNANKREIGDEAVWHLSTAKPGNGVVQLRDDNNDTFWQSDGSQPHLVSINFIFHFCS